MRTRLPNSPFLPAAHRPPGGDWCVCAGPAEDYADLREQGRCQDDALAPRTLFEPDDDGAARSTGIGLLAVRAFGPPVAHRRRAPGPEPRGIGVAATTASARNVST